ncbi:MAG: hypothetical protein JXR37_05545 [Kiritimatiellae bacterium]|nr:hypothetical protein [Kiritimatiellia bacterium]
MKAGFAEADITPELGMERPGGYGKAYIESIHDPLKVRAVVFDDGTERVALVGVDTCTISADAVGEARQRIRTELGIPQDHVLVAASHTHSGGPLFGFRPDAFDGAPPLVRDLAVNHSTVINVDYQDRVVSQIAAAVAEADRAKQEGRLSFGSGMEEKAAFNRRFRMKNGRTVTHPGKGNPAIVEPAGPIDPEVGVVGAWNADGELAGCVVNYACHATTSPGGASADWICYLEQTVRAIAGDSAVVVFLNGACGDVTQVDNQSRRERETGERCARRVGTRVGVAAAEVLVSTPRSDSARVAAVSRTVKIPRRRPTPESLARARAIVAEGPGEGKPSREWTFAKERLVLDYCMSKEPAVVVDVQAVQVGPAVFLANAAEYFCELGLEIKRRSRFPYTFVVELANGSVGYVPTAEAFEPTGGGYETVLTSYSNLEPGAGDTIAEASIALAQQLEPGPVPEFPPVIPPPQAGGYGVLGPELD